MDDIIDIFLKLDKLDISDILKKNLILKIQNKPYKIDLTSSFMNLLDSIDYNEYSDDT